MRTPEYRFLDIDVFGESTGVRYHGQVELKLFLNNNEKIEMARRTSRMVVGIDNRHEMFQLLQIICQIDTHMKTKPEWWGDGLDLEDNSPVLEIAKKLTEAQLEFAREKSGGKVGGKKEDGEGTV